MNIQTLCIQRVHTHINDTYIANVFKQLNIGDVVKIDVKKKTGYNLVFVHLKWYANETSKHAQTLLSSNKEIKVFYDRFWFWKIVLYKHKRQPQSH